MKQGKWLSIVVTLLIMVGCEEGSMSPDDSPSDEDHADSSSQQIADSLMGCNSEKERELIDLIQEYRAEEGLDAIPISQALTKVADLHVRDLIEHAPHENDTANCNLHSWSDAGSWSTCCYTPDHANASCMWAKPGELTDYEGSGYEIAYGRTGYTPTPEGSLEAWKDSEDHNNVIVNKGDWRNYEWEAMGVSLIEGFAVVWFGTSTDKQGEPGHCH